MRETWVQSLGWEDSPGEGHGNPLQYSCLEDPHGQRSLAGYSSWGCKDSDRTEGLSTAQHPVCSGGLFGKTKESHFPSNGCLKNKHCSDWVLVNGILGWIQPVDVGYSLCCSVFVFRIIIQAVSFAWGAVSPHFFFFSPGNLLTLT